MNDLVSISSRSSYLFNQVISASLLQPLGKNQSDLKSYRARVTLKISEHWNERTGEKELKLEISRADDHEFIFSESINHEKYEILAREFELTVDFETFPRTIIDKLLSRNICTHENEPDNRKAPKSFADVAPTEVNLILDSERTVCTFELIFKTPLSKGKIIGIKMNAVRGDQLTAHLLKTLKNVEKKSAKLSDLEKVNAELKKEIERLRREKDEASSEAKVLKDANDELNAVKDLLKLEKEDTQNHLQHIDELEATIEELRDALKQSDIDLETKDEEKETVAAELAVVAEMLREEQAVTEQLQKEKTTLRKLMEEKQEDLEKALKIIDKYVKGNQVQSCDYGKLKECEADLKEKETIIKTLTETTAKLRSEIESLKLENVQYQKTIDRLKDETQEAFKRIDILNSIPRGPPTTPGGFPRTPGLYTPHDSANRYRPVLGASALHDRSNMHRSTSPFVGGMHSPFDKLFGNRTYTPQKDVVEQNVTPK